MAESSATQLLLFLLAGVSIAWNVAALAYTYHRRPTKTRLLRYADERDALLVKLAKAAARSAFYMVVAITVGDVVVTVGSAIRNFYALPLVFEGAPFWLPYDIWAIYGAFYGMLYFPAFFLVRATHAIMVLDKQAAQDKQNADS